MKVINKLGNGIGKKILILSGVHGNELTPIYTTYLLNQMSFNSINVGEITILPTLNIHGIEQNTRNKPSDSYGGDINRALVFEEDKFSIDKLKKYIDDSDVVIDIHSSPDCTEFVLLNQNEYTDSYVEFCEKNNINYLIRYSNTNTIKKYCLDGNKTTFTIEINGINKIDPLSARVATSIVMNILDGINEFIPEKRTPTNPTYKEYYTYHSGIFIPFNNTGTIISKGDEIGMVINLRTFEETRIVFDDEEKHRIITFNDSDYVSGNIPICLLQKIKK